MATANASPRDRVLAALANLGYDLDRVALDRLDRFRKLLEDAARVHALTRIEGEDGYWERQVLDALSLVRALDPVCAADPHAETGASARPEPAFLPLRVLDVGAGAGIPSVPLAIALERHRLFRDAPLPLGCEVIALDSNQKKCAFLDDVARDLGLKNLRASPQRAEVAARTAGFRDAFDLVTARAVAELRTLVEFGLPFVRPGGLFVAWKGPRIREELEAARGALEALQATCEAVVPAGIDGRELVLVRIRKHGPTPERYPRRVGVPKKRPL